MSASTGSVSSSGDALDPTKSLASDAIHTTVERILAHPPFSRSDRLSRFLRFAVEQVLKGEGHKLKEYVLGVEVFDRDPASFDPRSDNIVRVEARRLRTSLIEYYATTGGNDPVLIEFPKGSYAPVFTERTGATPVAIPAAVTRRSITNRRVVLSLVIALIAGGALGLTYWGSTNTRTGDILPSVAVLPFVNFTGDPEQEYFTDGLTDEIIDALTRVEGLRVPARTSSFQFKGKPQDVRRIGEQLNVSTVLEGSVRKVGNRLKITAQLIKVSDGYHLWSHTQEREMKDVLEVQEETARMIVRTLRGNAAKGRLVTRPSQNLEAYNLYVKGRFFWYKWTAAGILKSIEYYEQAIAKDPNFALAYAGLANAYGVLGNRGDFPESEVNPKRDDALRRALEIDENLAETRHPLAMKKAFYDWDWAGAEREFRRIFEINPRFAEGHRSYSAVLNAMGRFTEAEREVQQAVALDPLSPFINSSVAAGYYSARQYDRVIEHCRKMLDMDPTFFRFHFFLGLAYEQKKMYSEAIQALREAQTLAPGNGEILAALGHVYGASGQNKEAEKILGELQDWSRRRYVSPSLFAIVYLGLRQNRAALNWLEKACEERGGRIITLKVDPIYDVLRSEPRYQTLLKRMGLGA